jgi:hypothetical protein
MGADKLVVPGRVSGREAVDIMLETLAVELGDRRFRAMERPIRQKVPPGANGEDWLIAIAQTIVENDDKPADLAFQKGMAKIRRIAASRTAMGSRPIIQRPS